MTDEKGQGRATFLAKYMEKLVLGVSLAALGIGTFVMFGMSGTDAAAPLQIAGQRLKAELLKKHAPGAPAPEKWQAQAVGPWNDQALNARAGDNWAASGTTISKGNGTTPPSAPPKKLHKIPDVLMGQVDVQVDHILLNWTIQDFTKEEKQKGAKEFDYGAITHFKVERQVKDKWEVLEPKLDAKILSYRDNKIEARTSYTYKVTACSTNKDGAGNTAAASVRSLGLWKLSFANPTKPAPDARGGVFVTIEKFEQGVGKVTIRHNHLEGDAIGTWAESAGTPPSSAHKISLPQGRAVEVDWNSGATLVTVQPLKVMIPFEKCTAKNSPQGRVGCILVVNPRPVTTTLIVYTDADGRHELYSPALPDKNERCSIHGGRSKAGTDTEQRPAPLAKMQPDPSL